MSKQVERALLLAAGEIPPGNPETKCRVETNGTSIGIVVATGKTRKLLSLAGIADLKTLVRVSQEFLDKTAV